MPGSVLVDETTSRNISLTVVRSRGTFGDVSVFFYAQSIVDGTNLGLDYRINPQVRAGRLVRASRPAGCRVDW